MGKGKPEPAPEPIDRLEERRNMTDAAFNKFLELTVEFAQENELSSAEMFAIISKTMHVLSETAMQAEQEEYFGPGAEDDES